MKSKISSHKWKFPTRIRPNAFSWKSSRVAVQRIKEAVAEISIVARHDGILAAEGGVRLIERLSPALEHVDSSSGALGSAVNGAIEALVPIIAAAPVGLSARRVISSSRSAQERRVRLARSSFPRMYGHTLE